LRAQFIYEKFDEKTDPISDMGIGGIRLNKVYNEIMNKAEEEWIEYLHKNLVGRKVTGKMLKWGEHGHQWKRYCVKVKSIFMNKSASGEVTINDADNEHYTIFDDQKIYID
jgi:hypothetical protein